MDHEVETSRISQTDSLLPTQLDTARVRDRWIKETPSALTGMTAWAAAIGVVCLMLTVAIVVRMRDTPPRAAAPAPVAAHDGVVHVRATDMGDPCASGFFATREASARAQVALDIDASGHVTRVSANGPMSSQAASCLQTHIGTWDFLPQAAPVSMVVDVSVDRL